MFAKLMSPGSGDSVPLTFYPKAYVLNPFTNPIQ